MDNWTMNVVKMLKDKEPALKAKYNEDSIFYVKEYKARCGCLDGIGDSVDELEKWLEDNRRNLRQWRLVGRKYELRLKPCAKIKAKAVPNLYSEKDALLHMENHKSWFVKGGAKNWLEWIFDQDMKGRKVFVKYAHYERSTWSYSGRGWYGMCLRSKPVDFPHESNLTQPILDKLIELAEVKEAS